MTEPTATGKPPIRVEPAAGTRNPAMTEPTAAGKTSPP